MIDWQVVAVAAALIAFNIPVVYTTIRLLTSKVPADPAEGATAPVHMMAAAVQEKDPDGNPTGVSFSRVTGLVGTAVVASLFWVMSNIVVVAAILDPSSLSSILGEVTKLFLIGAALFVPYAFNQLKTLLQ